MCAVHKRTLTVLLSEKAPARRKRPWQFSDFIFFFFQFFFFSTRCSSRTLRGVVLRSFNTVSRGFPTTVFFCTLESAAVQHANEDFPSFSDDAYL